MLRPGDILATAAGTIGKTLLYEKHSPACYAGYLVRVRPRKGVDARFIAYWMESKPYWWQIATGKVVSTIENFSASKYQNLRLSIPGLLAQRGIADYLDRETGRIDALIAAKRRMVGLLEKRWQGLLEATIQSLAQKFGEVRLKYMCSEIVVGIVITPAAWYADSGVPALRGSNVRPGKISLDDLVYLTPEGHTLHPKSRLRSGDVVIVRTGQAGTAAVVPKELDGANCIDLVIIRPLPTYASHFLEYVLNSDWMQKHIEEHSVGTIQSHFNIGAAGMVPVPAASRGAQESAIRVLDAERRRVSAAVDAIRRQIGLLQERRQALITMAVTGQLEISEAA